jgi:hypothetical protein
MKINRKGFSVPQLLLIVAAAGLLAAGGYVYVTKIARSKPAPAANQIAQPVSQPQSQPASQAAELEDDIEDTACTDLLKLPNNRLKMTRLPSECGKAIDIGKGFKNWKYVSISFNDPMTVEFAGPTLALWDENGKFIQKIADTSNGMLFGTCVDFSDDINYDGYKDLKIKISSGPADVEIEEYNYWIFNPESKKYHKDPVLTHVANPDFGKNQKMIYSKVGVTNRCFFTPKCNGEEMVYRFADGTWRQAYGSGDLPKFEDFPLKEIFTGKPAAVDFSNDPQAKKLNETGGANGACKGLITGEVAKGPNFNGHYRVIDWSCGTNCRSVLIVDVANGGIAYSPFIKTPTGVYDPRDLKPWNNLGCRINSSLMIVNGNHYDFETDDLSLPYLIDVKNRTNKAVAQ